MRLVELLEKYGDDESALESLSSFGQPLAYYPKLAKVFGGVTHAVFISQFLYWHGKEKADGWVYKTIHEITEETGLTKREQESARRTFRDLKLLEEKKVGMPAQNHYKFKWQAVAIAIHQWKQNAPSSGRKTRRPVDAKRAHKWAQNASTSGAETCSLYNVSENTTETTHREIARGDNEVEIAIENVRNGAGDSASDVTAEGLKVETSKRKADRTAAEEYLVRSLEELKVPRTTWDAYVDMRVRIRKPLTGRAVEMAMQKLRRLKRDGNDPAEVLDESTFNCWQGLFPLDKGHGRRGQPRAGDGFVG